MAQDWGDTFLDAYQRSGTQYLRNQQLDREMKLREAADARAAEVHARQVAQQREQDEAFRNLRTLQRDGVVSSAGGLAQPSAQMIYSGATGYGQGAGAVQEATGDYAREMSRFGLPQTYDATAPVSARTAKKSEIAQGLTDVALAQRDVKGAAAGLEMKEGALDDELMASVKAPKPGTPEYQEWADKLSTHMNVQSRTITIGEPDKMGFRRVSFVTPNGKAQFIKLSAAEQLRIAQADALMDRNPNKAYAMIASINKDLAAAVRAENDDVIKEVDNSNDTMTRILAARNDAARTAQGGAALKKMEEGLKLAQEAEGYAQGYIRAKKLGTEGAPAANIYDENYRRLAVRGAGLGLRLPELGKPEVDPAKHAAVIKDLVTAGVPLAQARIEADRMFGLANPDQNVVAELKKLDASKQDGAPKGVPSWYNNPENVLSRALHNADSATLDAYDKMINNQPTSPRERELLRKAGIPIR